MMITKNIVIFGEDWGGLPSSTQHLTKSLLKKGWCVIWVNSIGLRQPRLNIKDVGRLFNKIKQIFHKKQINIEDKSKYPLIIKPLIIPVIGNRFINKINRVILKYQYKKIKSNLIFKEPLVLTALPTASVFRGIFDEKSWHYYCCDDFSFLANVSNKKVTKCEIKLASFCKNIFISNAILSSKFKTNNVFLIEHGFYIEQFNKILLRPADLPNSDKVVGFYGSLESWLDLTLLSYCIEELKDWQFVFIGHKKGDILKLDRFQNVSFLGFKPYNELSAYIQHWQVSLLPFKLNKQIEACNPLKLKEYLAGGSYVVSTDFRVARNYLSVIHISKNNKDFVRLIKDQKKDTADKSDRRKKLISKFTWDNQAKILSSELQKSSE